DRVNQLARRPILRYISGDGQTGLAGQPLENPLVVEILDGEDKPVEGVLVQFEPSANNGSANPAGPITDQQGRAQTQWTLAPQPALQSVTARALGTTLTVTFQATATTNPPT